MLVTIFIVVIALFIVFSAYIISDVIIPKRNQRILHKKFNALESSSSWTRKTESTNPFITDKVRVIAKQMGTDGKTPWIIIERQSGFKDYMKFENFIDIYTQI